MRWEPIHETPFVLYGVVVQGWDWIQWTWTVMLFSRMFSSKPHKMTRCGSLAFRPIWNSWHKADKWVCEFWGEAVKGSGRQGGVFLFFFSLTPLKRTPGKFGRLTAEVEPAATKQEGECFHVFMCVFSFTPGTYIYTYIYVAAGLSLRPWAECDGGSLRGIRPGLGTTCGTPSLSSRQRCFWGVVPPPPFTPNVPNQWKAETQRVSLTLIWKKACLEWI